MTQTLYAHMNKKNEKENIKFHHVHLEAKFLYFQLELLFLSTTELKHCLNMCYKYEDYMGLSHPSQHSTAAIK
jgi:hypothetical protein